MWRHTLIEIGFRGQKVIKKVWKLCWILENVLRHFETMLIRFFFISSSFCHLPRVSQNNNEKCLFLKKKWWCYGIKICSKCVSYWLFSTVNHCWTFRMNLKKTHEYNLFKSHFLKYFLNCREDTCFILILSIISTHEVTMKNRFKSL